MSILKSSAAAFMVAGSLALGGTSAMAQEADANAAQATEAQTEALPQLTEDERVLITEVMDLSACMIQAQQRVMLGMMMGQVQGPQHAQAIMQRFAVICQEASGISAQEAGALQEYLTDKYGSEALVEQMVQEQMLEELQERGLAPSAPQQNQAPAPAVPVPGR